MTIIRSEPNFSTLGPLTEHEVCLTALAELEGWLDHPVADGLAWLAAVRQLVPRVHAALSEHFALEEAGPLFRVLPLEFPHFSDRLSRLQREHGPLLAQAADASERVRTLSDPEVYDLRELCGRLQLLVAVVRRHEAEEDETVLSAYWQDPGAGD